MGLGDAKDLAAGVDGEDDGLAIAEVGPVFAFACAVFVFQWRDEVGLACDLDEPADAVAAADHAVAEGVGVRKGGAGGQHQCQEHGGLAHGIPLSVGCVPSVGQANRRYSDRILVNATAATAAASQTATRLMSALFDPPCPASRGGLKPTTSTCIGSATTGRNANTQFNVSSPSFGQISGITTPAKRPAMGAVMGVGVSFMRGGRPEECWRSLAGESGE